MLLLGLGGCEQVFDQQYATPPTLNRVTVAVEWVEPHEVADRCGNKQSYGCATIGTAANPTSLIIAMRPRSFSDSVRVQALGHEMLHALGAKHE